MPMGVVFSTQTGLPVRVVNVPDGELDAQARGGEAVFDLRVPISDLQHWSLVDGKPERAE